MSGMKDTLLFVGTVFRSVLQIWALEATAAVHYIAYPPRLGLVVNTSRGRFLCPWNYMPPWYGVAGLGDPK